MAFRVIPVEWAHTVDQRKERRLQRIWRTFKSSIDLRVCVSALETLLLCVQQTRFVDMRRRCSGRILGIETWKGNRNEHERPQRATSLQVLAGKGFLCVSSRLRCASCNLNLSTHLYDLKLVGIILTLFTCSLVRDDEQGSQLVVSYVACSNIIIKSDMFFLNKICQNYMSLCNSPVASSLVSLSSGGSLSLSISGTHCRRQYEKAN